MFNREMAFDSTLHAMNDGYVRLLEAARELRRWDSPAEVARGLTAAGYPVSEQILTNWKKRGISAAGLLEVCKIIGCRCEFIRAGQLPIADAKLVSEYSDIAIRGASLIDKMQPEDQIKLIHYLQVAIEQQTKQIT